MEQIKKYVICFALAAPIAFAFGFLSLKFSEFECAKKAKIMSLPYKYAGTAGCFVKLDGQWVPVYNKRMRP